MNIAICALFLAVALGYSFEAFVARRRQAAMVHDLNRVCGLYMDTLYRASKDPEQRPVLQEFMDALPRHELIAASNAESLRATFAGFCGFLSLGAAVLSYYLIP